MKNITKKHYPLYGSIILIGFTAIVTQVVFIRELLVIFYGNELSLGTMLAVWLLWTALGSIVLPKIFLKNSALPTHLGLGQYTIGLSLPVILFFIRISKSLFGITSGEMMGFIPMVIISIITLGPFCLCSGFLYTLTCQLVRKTKKQPYQAIGNVYLLEAIGSGLGGVIVGLLLIPTFKSIHILIIFSLFNLISASAIILLYNNVNKIKMSILLFFVGVVGFLMIFFSAKFQKYCDTLLWKGYNLISSQNTIYGNLAAVQLGEQYSFFQNGLHIFTVPDRFTAEESVHYTLLQHPNPQNILLIGGGFGGSIQEIQRYPAVEKIDYVDLDPGILDMVKNVLPPDTTKYIKNRVYIHHTDGRWFVKKTKNKYDAILCNLPNPYTAQINRFYTAEFFREVTQKLNRRGVFSIQVNASENAIGPELSDFLSSLYATFHSVFKEVILIPGEVVRFIGSNQSNMLTDDPDTIIQRIHDNELQTLYVREYYIPYQLSQERKTYLFSKIRTVPQKNWNLDFSPIGYYYDTVLWATYFSSGFKQVFVAFSLLEPLYFIGFLILVSLFFFLRFRFSRTFNFYIRRSVQFSTFIVGFSEISLEVILILAFQILYGYAYYLLSFLLAGYMLGLAVGSMCGIRHTGSFHLSFIRFRSLQLTMIVYPLFLIILMKFLTHSTVVTHFHTIIIILFALLTWLAGFIGGYQFTLANKLSIQSGKSLEKTAGFLYGLDLIGSAIGAFIISAFVIPIFGIFPALLLLSVMNGCGYVIILLSPSFPKK